MNVITDEINEVIKLERKLLTSEGRSDIEFLKSVLSDDFEECGASGEIFGKDEVLADLPSEDDTVKLEAYDMNARKISDDIIANNFNAHIIKDGKETESYRLSLWRKSNGGWIMFYHQGTYIS